jgi:predicted HAD superfamily Cof-like phosphohydrolase
METVPPFTRPLVPDHELRDVREFMLKFGQLVHNVPGHLTKRKLGEREVFMQEELNEFKEAASKQDLAGMADALVDLCYVLKGTAIMLGLPWEALWADVHRANMSKVKGLTHRGHLVDAKKPEGWIGPKTWELLEEFGYVRASWCTPEWSAHHDESKCRDDEVHQEASHGSV